MYRGPYMRLKRKDTQRGHMQQEVEVGVKGPKPRKTDLRCKEGVSLEG